MLDPNPPPFGTATLKQNVLGASDHDASVCAVTTLQIIVSIVYMLILEYFKYLEIESISVKTATLVSLLLIC